MTNITLSIPDELYKKMKKYSEIKWSEVVRKAIIDYIKRIEEGGFKVSAKELLKNLDEEFRREVRELSLDDAIEGFRKMSEEEW
ncbi:MAG: ribbon-helix-helix domain-containing protein, partial [Nitrososphaeria archaeon]